MSIWKMSLQFICFCAFCIQTLFVLDPNMDLVLVISNVVCIMCYVLHSAHTLYVLHSAHTLGPTQPFIQWVLTATFFAGKTADAWYWPLNSIYCRGCNRRFWVRISIRIFIARQVHSYFVLNWDYLERLVAKWVTLDKIRSGDRRISWAADDVERLRAVEHDFMSE
jgi:hypothetical protein